MSCSNQTCCQVVGTDPHRNMASGAVYGYVCVSALILFLCRIIIGAPEYTWARVAFCLSTNTALEWRFCVRGHRPKLPAPQQFWLLIVLFL